MSRKFVGKLIRIMMTKSSSCDILKKKRTIRRGSGSRLKGSYLMDLRVLELCHSRWFYYNVCLRPSTYAVLELCHSRWFYYRHTTMPCSPFVLELCHSRWFYYPFRRLVRPPRVLELCHSRWFYYAIQICPALAAVLELCHSRWFYYPLVASSASSGFGTMSFQMVLLPVAPFDVGRGVFWNYVIPDGSTTS